MARRWVLWAYFGEHTGINVASSLSFHLSLYGTFFPLHPYFSLDEIHLFSLFDDFLNNMLDKEDGRA